MQTFADWDVPKDFAQPFYNYLVYGFSPGSCFTAVLANDFASAISRSHPSNTIEAYKALVGWIRDTVPEEGYGSYEKVKAWGGITLVHAVMPMASNTQPSTAVLRLWHLPYA